MKSVQTSKELILLRNQHDLTPLHSPLFAWKYKSHRTPAHYLNAKQRPFGEKVAKWQKRFFEMPELPQYYSEPKIEPLYPGAPTMIAIFYHNPTVKRRSLGVYLDRIQILARMGGQMIIYVPPDLSTEVRKMRTDKHWHVIDDYPTIWDIPNNTFQYENFKVRQLKIFERFDGFDETSHWKPQRAYNSAYLSAVYNAKAFVTYDAIMRNPFGSERWMYIDAGMFEVEGPRDEHGTPWGKLLKERLDTEKFDRSINISRDTGIVIGEYKQSEEYGIKDINHECWSDPNKIWLCHQFIANMYVGSSLGMLNYSVRYMQTVDDMDANGIYSAREEYVIPWVTIRYPNTVFSMPFVYTAGMESKWECPMKFGYTTYGNTDHASSAPPIVDPISTMICRGYQPRHRNLAGHGVYNKAHIPHSHHSSREARTPRSTSMHSSKRKRLENRHTNTDT